MSFTQHQMLSLEHGHKFDPSTGVLQSCSNGGLFSNFYHTIWSIVDLQNMGYFVENIDFSKGYNLFRDSTSHNLYPEFFKRSPPAIQQWKEYAARTTSMPRIDHHGVYSLYPYQMLNKIRNAYFLGSDKVNVIENRLAAKYSLESGKFLALYYRGTDKGTEIRLPQPKSMLKSLFRTMESTGIKKVLVQTDDQSVQDFYRQHLDDMSIIEELPVTSGIKGFHYQNDNGQLIDRFEFSLYLIAMSQILACAKSLVMCTSNVSGWICLIRGDAEEVIQFNKNGQEVTPAYRQIFRVKNQLRQLRSHIRGDKFYYV